MKTHNPTSKANAFRFSAWHRRGMEHWRTWDEFTATLQRRLNRVFSGHLARGGTVTEVFHDERYNIAWKLGANVFTAPAKHCPKYLADHVTNRVVGFGWKVRLA